MATTGFGGSVMGASISNSEVSSQSSKRRTVVGDKKGRTETVVKARAPIEETKLSSDVIGAKMTLKHAFGCSTVLVDALQSYSFPAIGGDKETNDKLIYRAGKQVCVFDVESSTQQFLQGRARKVKNILHFCIGPGNRYLSVCESLRLDKDEECPAQISVYNLTTMIRLKTMSHQCSADFVQSVFCGDPKYLASLTGEGDRQVVVWQWEKEKLHKLIQLTNMPVTRIRAGPCNALMITTSGRGILKSWFIGPDGLPRQGHLLPANREAETFIDHAWLPSVGGIVHKMVALCDFNDVHSQPPGGLAAASSDHLTGSTSSAAGARRQNVFVFEGTDVMNANNLTSAPISLELRQAITVKINDHSSSAASAQLTPSTPHITGGASAAAGVELAVDAPKVESIIPTTKGFLLVGGMGFVAIYERAVDKRESFVETRRLSLGDIVVLSATLTQGEERLHVIASNNRILSVSLGLDVSGGIDAEGEDSNIAALVRRRAEKSDKRSDPDSRPDSRGAVNPHLATDLNYGGFHLQPIVAADIARERPFLLTVSTDRTARLWNYETVECKIVHNFRADEPIAVAMSPTGYQALVSFKDRVRLYNVLLDKLRPYKETICKNCKDLAFSNGGHMWAGASSINVVIYDSATFHQLAVFQGHMMSIKRLAWAPGDEIVFSAGGDGNVYGWPVSRENRVDVISANNRSSAIYGLAIDCPFLLFRKRQSTEGLEEDGGAGATLTAQQHREQSCSVIVSTADGSLKIPEWNLDGKEIKSIGDGRPSAGGASGGSSGDTVLKVVAPDDRRVFVTAMTLSADRKYLFAGTSAGTVRSYLWPPGGPDGIEVAYAESYAHAAPVVSIKESPLGNCVISAGEDGSVFIHTFVREKVVKAVAATAASGTGTGTGAGGGTLSSLNDLLLDTPSAEITFNNDVVLMSNEDVEEHIHEIIDLQKSLHETTAKFEFQFHQREVEHGDEVKKIVDTNDHILHEERAKYEHLRMEFDNKVRDLRTEIEVKEGEHVKVTSELENRYEHKIADQMERYDRLTEDMELLKQKYEGLVLEKQNEFAKQLNFQRNEARLREKRLKTETKRLSDDRQADTNAFREILDQQEEEYESELRELIGAAEGELENERETIEKLRTLVQTKNTKLDQLKKKLLEISNASKARLALLDNERKEKVRLQETIEHYKKNLREREEALSEKERMILELRNTTRTLENFRFVLDHRLQQLSSERGPITTHIEGLERHITTMYEELVEEFDNKKSAAVTLEQKEKKIAMLTQDLTKCRLDGKKNEQFIYSFKRDLGNIANSMVAGKELEETVRNLYKKYVRGEKVGETSLKTKDGVQDKVNHLMKQRDDDDSSIMSEINENRGNGRGGGGGGGAAGGGGGHHRGRGHGGMSKSEVKEVEEALIESAKEAERQKRFVERESDNLRHRLTSCQTDIARVAKTKLAENSNLIFECNNLRRDVRDLERKLAVANAELSETKRMCHKLKYEARSSGSPQPRPVSDGGEGFQETVDINGEDFAPMEGTTAPDSASVHRVAQTANPTSTAAAAGVGPAPNTATAQSAVDTSRKWVVHSSLANSQSTGVLKANLGSASQSKKWPSNGIGPNVALTRNGLLDSGAGIRSTPALVAPPLDSVEPLDKAKMSAKAMAIKKNAVAAAVHNELVVERLTREVTNLTEQLDSAYRERDMQRREIARMRKMAAQAVMMPSGNASIADDSNAGGSQEIYNAYNSHISSKPDLSDTLFDGPEPMLDSVMIGSRPMTVDRRVTTADITGKPSAADLRDLAFGPVGTTRGSTPTQKSRGLPVRTSSASRQRSPQGKASAGGAKQANSIKVPKVVQARGSEMDDSKTSQ